MIASEFEFEQALEQLRADGSDSWALEVKRASGGVPQIANTLCAFANMPEGGTMIFGLDEASGFSPVGVDDAAALEQGVASQARQAIDPPAQVSFWQAKLNGKTLVIANVMGLPSFDKPCRVTASRKAYLRFADGDYVLSEQEIQQMLSARDRPRHDVAVIDGATRGDLDSELTRQFLKTARAASKRLDREDDEQILRLKRVLEPRGDRLTLAGLYALGRYPQQFVPSMSLTAVLRPLPGTSDRNADRQEFDGPLAEILEDAVNWVVRNIRTRVRFGHGGHGYDATEVPVVAIREIIANALVHRDLSQHTWGKDVQLILENDRLIVANPGGLWGLTTDQLGKGNAKSAVNEFLYDICQLTTTSEGHRIIEGEGGGLREVRRVLRRSGMREPAFFDSGVRFTAILPRHTLLTEQDFEWLDTLPHHEDLSDIQRQVLVSMRRGQAWTNQTMRDEFGPLDSTEARTLLQGLVYLGLVETSGGGRGTTYRIKKDWEAELGTDDQPHIELQRLNTLRWEESQPSGSTGEGTEGPGQRAAAVTRHGKVLWRALGSSPKDVHQLVEDTDLNVAQVRYAIAQLINEGIVVRHGGQGHRDTTYSVASGQKEEPESPS